MKRLTAMIRVLLVDDDVELGEMLTEYLEREGFGRRPWRTAKRACAARCRASTASWCWT
jgi:hypothetical protein